MTSGDQQVAEGAARRPIDDDTKDLYERAPFGYLSTTPDGTIIRVNETFFAMTGYASDDLLGRKRFVDLLNAGGRIYHETHYTLLLRMHGSAREIAFDLVCADGQRLPVLVNSVLEHDASGNPVVIRTAVLDASHRRRYEQELLREKERAEASEARATALARTLQQTLIPPHVPDIEGLEVAAEYRPAGDGSEVGGDFYDIFQAGDDDWVVVIGDVCGKGVDAAIVTALARYTLRAAAVQDPSPSHALRLLNDALHRAETDRFCTAAMLRLVRCGSNWRAATCSAGHPLPLRIDATGHVVPVGEAGSLIGVLDEVDLVESTVLLAPGDALVVYTDGVSEARASGGDFYGEARLFDHLAATSGTASQIATGVLEQVLDFQDGLARDDIAVVSLRVPTAGAQSGD